MLALVIRGASEATPPIGYNTSYLYPRDGLNALAQGLAQGCDVRYGKRVAKVDIPSKTVYFQDGSSVRYESLLSTLPLNKMIEMTGLKIEEEPDPYTSVLVLNIGGVRGAAMSARPLDLSSIAAKRVSTGWGFTAMSMSAFCPVRPGRPTIGSASMWRRAYLGRPEAHARGNPGILPGDGEGVAAMGIPGRCGGGGSHLD